ncbi:glutamate--tRNA ligase [Candidatus Peregrinibacteria bacterium CG10_big_fil_rev_8_21_14_0_10_55_24]|nr:MAG: glutamate--tRNA ligase [Candidatus Peregrinibacteria bacterium CG10_big_fil_rev_8_21_14_0_10_55_24]
MRTRFAPSPTGFLHVGGLRTALFSYLVAKQTGGEFLVRIEDTDQERSVEGALKNILHTLHWAGLEPDEGVILRKGGIAQEGGKGPYIQSQRLELYRSYAEKLLADGHAYIAFDTKEEIDRMRTRQAQAGVASPKYDASVRMNMRNALTMSAQEVQEKLAGAEPYVIRMKMPAETQVSFEDDIRGVVSFNTRELDDQVLLKSDGFPTYHLAHVVDDHLMDIGIVIRGEEWLPSLPKHVLLFEAFGWRPPRYAHVPLLLNTDRSKLSKRQSSVAVEEFREKGYMPEAFLNFIALLGWNPGTEQEIFSLPMLIEAFSLDRVQKGGAVFDTEKLDWLQGQWVRQLSTEEFSRAILPLVTNQFPKAEYDPLFEQRAHLIQERITFLKEAPSMLQYFYEDPIVKNDLLANAKQKITETMLPDILIFLQETLETVLADEWTQDVLKEKLLSAAKLKGYKHGQVLWPLRAALTGLPFSPGAFEVAAALGRDTTLARIEMAMQSL